MAYENEKERIISEISSAVGFGRTRDSALEREATERAYEARLQTGLTYDGPQDIIVHPSGTERQQRLGIPSTVGTAELATWNYMYADPIEAVYEGLLNSPSHRAVLDNSYYDHWGIGIYTEMPSGQTNELYRRWWVIIWLASDSVGEASSAKPSEIYDPPVIVFFRKGKHKGYKFGFDGSVLDTKTVTLGRSRYSRARGRGSIEGQSGKWLLVNNKFFADYWVPEGGFVINPVG